MTSMAEANERLDVEDVADWMDVNTVLRAAMHCDCACRVENDERGDEGRGWDVDSRSGAGAIEPPARGV